MRLKKNGKGAACVWALCIICILFSGICRDNVPADLCLAYQETALTTPDGAGQDAVVSAFSVERDAAVSGFRAEQDAIVSVCRAEQDAAVSGFRAGQDAVVSAFSTPQKEDASVFSAPQKGIPAQAYVPKGQAQGNAALAPRKTVQRTNPRCQNSSAAGILPEGIFSDTNFSGRRACSFDGLCEVFSNTVILQYIHRQDGEK